MHKSKTWHRILAAATLALIFGGPDAAMAGPKQDALLQTYVGSWRGTGELKGGDEPEKFSCRVDVKDGGQGKINYAGRCAVVGMNLQVQGTIAYRDERNRYEGVMNSTTAFKGLAIGRPRGNTVVFDFRGQEKHEGSELTINSQMTLKKEQIVIDFNVWIAESDVKMSTSVPFDRVPTP
ncbi:MAG: hypothetical protein KKH72_06825 [Alphaproteobacteria bacterium]|nr:hypothetical protein [Alphaproteobacteria bacterium]